MSLPAENHAAQNKKALSAYSSAGPAVVLWQISPCFI